MEELVMRVLTSIGLAVAVTFAGYLLKWLHIKVKLIKNELISEVALNLVRAAEQKFQEATGEEKLAWVKEQAQKLGIKISDVDIEAAVYFMNYMDFIAKGKQ